MKRVISITALAVIVLCAIPGESAAQNSYVLGSVQTTDALPVAGATVRLEGTPRGTLTDAQGHFRIDALVRGNYTIVAEQLGYVTQTRQITLTDSAFVRFVLSESPVALSGVVVTATGAAELQMTATSTIGTVTGLELRELKASHPAEVLSRIAGAWVNVAGSGEGHMTAIRQPLTTNPVYLYLEDGIPTRSTGFFNHNALYEINLPQAGRVEVLKGPGTALYGSDAIGGVINAETRAPSLERTIEWFGEAGGHGWNRALVSVSGSEGRHGLRADLNYTRWGGWRDETGYDRQSLTLRWDYHTAGAARIKTVFAFSDIDQIDPSPLARTVFEQDAAVNEFPIATRSIRALRLSSSFTTTAGNTEFALTPFLRTNEMDIVPSWMLSFDPVTYRTGHESVGMIARARRELPALRSTITAGSDLDYSPGFRTEHRITTTRQDGVFTSFERGELIYNYDVAFTGAAPYVQVESRPFGGLHVDAGLRYDYMRYNYDNRLDPLQTGIHRRPADTQVAFSQLAPKFGWSYDFGRAALFGSYRHAFRAPSEGQLFRQGSAANTVGLEPIRARALEAGARAAFEQFDFEVSGYAMRVFDDVLTFVTENNQREAVNAGETRHRGIEISAGWNAAEWLRLDAAATHVRHSYEAWQPRDTINYAGNEMAVAPRNLLNMRARFSPALLRGGMVAVDYQRVGEYWENPENTSRYEGHGLLNVRARVPLLAGLDALVRISNVLDERYAEQATFNQFDQERLTPGAPRMIYLGVQGRWPELKP